ncbi:hypothetical protein QA601_06325 [Chitinispirillales bacterium ANBcel5]|uniref:hypothetical protein n=1 Tax=Cellulosispirillum alkaliphilum TaxID=3039283 RepID=UPI002A4EC212|nr:hypothetical protein [Chitinispirillales bacterium ANBcel5]
MAFVSGVVVSDTRFRVSDDFANQSDTHFWGTDGSGRPFRCRFQGFSCSGNHYCQPGYGHGWQIMGI